MNLREADLLAWRLARILDAADETVGHDRAHVVAQAAVETVDCILSECPKIARAMDNYRYNAPADQTSDSEIGRACGCNDYSDNQQENLNRQNNG